MSSVRSPAAIAFAVAIFVIHVVVWATRYGGIYTTPFIAYALLAAAIVLPWWPRFRRVAAGSSVLALAAVVFNGYDRLVAGGYASWWPAEYLGFAPVIWLPVIVVCVLSEIAIPSSAARLVHASSPIAAVAFMLFSTIGRDVITSYDSPTPFLAAALTAIVLPWLSIDRLPVFVQVLVRVFEPLIVVIAGWAAAYFAGRGDVDAGDLRWLLPYIALPAIVGAAIGAFRSMRRQHRAA